MGLHARLSSEKSQTARRPRQGDEDRAAYWDFGTVEGYLSAIQDSSGKLELRVRDPLWDGQIKCFVTEQLLPQAMDNFRRRVEVGGEVRYRANGSPESIRATSLEALPDDADLPTAAEVRGLLGGAAYMLPHGKGDGEGAE